MRTITASQLRREGWDEILAYVRGARQAVAITRYGVTVAHLAPVPEIIVSDPNTVFAERMKNSSKNSAKTPAERSGPSDSPSDDAGQSA